ncbi:MAG: 2OG-Fe dioxygenase family protein [Acetobacteraceae bacterium]|nr:2OG-Fe dioxygenase family protein [Acetobacteraceae bacterium]
MSALRDGVAAAGYVRLRPEQSRAALAAVPDSALAAFAGSWDRLETDAFMADGGRYRRRRIANFLTCPGLAGHVRGLHRPHFQAVVHNSLNGGVDRWFAPCEDDTIANPACQALLELGRPVAEALEPGVPLFAEMHQFRIEAQAGSPGYPTPEGVHQDGVTCVLIAMLRRENLTGGETVVTDLDRRELARFTLDGLLDLVLLDDRRVAHGVSPIAPTDPERPSMRDVLVLTWKRAR